MKRKPRLTQNLAYNSIVKHPICWYLEFLAVTHQRLSCPKKVVDSSLHPAIGIAETLKTFEAGLQGKV